MWYRTIGRMTNLVDFFRLESVLQDLEITDELVFMFCIHLHSAHWDVACRQKRVKKCVSVRRRGYTIDRIEDLAVCAACPALLDLSVVELEEVVDPSDKFCARFSHRGQQSGG